MSDDETTEDRHYFHVTEPPCDECAQANRRLIIISAVAGAAAAGLFAFVVLRRG